MSHTLSEHHESSKPATQFGLLSYGVTGTIASGVYATTNVGDDIQSIAARQFLPRIDLYHNREYIRCFESAETVKMILNGWYCHNAEAWPPSKAIDGLATSICVNSTNQKTVRTFLSESAHEFYHTHGPIGARDEVTLKFFTDSGIPAFYSGCLTLTLTADPRIPKQDYILAVDIPAKVLDMLRKKTTRPIYTLHPIMRPGLSESVRREAAETYLALYQSAHCVITSRLHACLPSIALGTPVLLLDVAKDQYRFAGLKNFAHNTTPNTFLANPDLFNVDTPPPNPETYLEFRNKLIRQCETFTGTQKSDSFMSRNADIPTFNFLPVMMENFTKMPDFPLHEYKRLALFKAFFKRIFNRF